MNLLPSEQEAADFVRRIGIERSQRILDALCRRFDRRFQRACDQSFVPISRDWVMRTDIEKELTHKIKIGVSLVDNYHTPAAAKARVLARIAERKKRRNLKSA